MFNARISDLLNTGVNLALLVCAFFFEGLLKPKGSSKNICQISI